MAATMMKSVIGRPLVASTPSASRPARAAVKVNAKAGNWAPGALEIRQKPINCEDLSAFASPSRMFVANLS